MPERGLGGLFDGINWAAMAVQVQTFIDATEEMMIGWVPIGECYVKPIDWEELWLIEPQGVGYAAYRHHTNMDERIFVGVAPSPAAAARLITSQVRRAAGEVDHDEPRINHGLPPRGDGGAGERIARRVEAQRRERDRIAGVVPGGRRPSAEAYPVGEEPF